MNEPRNCLSRVEWKRRLGQRLCGQSHHRPGTVVARDAIGAQHAAALAAMNNCPFAIRPHPDRNRLHAARADTAAITWRVVEMQAPQTMRAMIPMPRAK